MEYSLARTVRELIAANLAASSGGILKRLKTGIKTVSDPGLSLAIREASKGWKAIHHWKPALQSFQVMFGEERVPLNAL